MQFGIIGCGTIAQIMHLPYLAEIPETELHALVDPAIDRANALGDRYNVPHRFEDAGQLLDAVGSELDAVVVLTPAHTHADVVVDTLDADIPTLVEKPLAATLADADRMVEAAERSDATAMVAYMKRYDPAYERAQQELETLTDVDLVTAYDVDPDHGRIIDEVYDLVGGALPNGFVEESVAERREQIKEAIGTDDETLVAAYDFQLDHVCHDVNALRGLFGDVKRINHVEVFDDHRYLVANLEYEGGEHCVLESGDSDRKWFEQFIRVDAPNGMLNLKFSNPFIQNTPTELRVKSGIKEVEDTTHTPSYDEPFKRELERFIHCVEDDAVVRTTFLEARDDLELIIELFRTYRAETSGDTRQHA